MSDPAAPFDFPIRVRYEETDRMGVVYHGKFFEYFEVGRTEWLRWLAPPPEPWPPLS